MTAWPLTAWQYPSIKIYSSCSSDGHSRPYSYFWHITNMKRLKKMHQKGPRYYPSNYTFKRIFVSSVPPLAYSINNWRSDKITLCEVGTQVPLNLAHHSLFVSNVFKYLQHCLKTYTSLQTHTPVNSQYGCSYRPLPLKRNPRGWRTTPTASSEQTVKYPLSAGGSLLLGGSGGPGRHHTWSW